MIRSMYYVIITVIVIAILLAFLMWPKDKVVGRDIAPEDITEFVYTRSSSTFPPSYQRYRLYTDGGTYKFYHEKREGTHWPLTESDITISGSRELSNEEWKEILGYLEGGKATKRKEHTESGGSGLSLYLYWTGDGSKDQEFSFITLEAKDSFEKFCDGLAVSTEKERRVNTVGKYDFYTEEGTMLIDYYTVQKGTPTGEDEGKEKYEIVLKSCKEADFLLLEEYVTSFDGEENVKCYKVPRTVLESCYRIIEERGFKQWEGDGISIDGKLSVCRFYDGEKYFRVSTDSMPHVNGEEDIERIGRQMADYLREEYLIE